KECSIYRQENLTFPGGSPGGRLILLMDAERVVVLGVINWVKLDLPVYVLERTMKESSQLKTVLNDPVFKAGPLAALHQHLQSTQPVLEKPPRKKETRKKGQKKKKKAKTSIGSQTMEE
ncbi:hypothetical protein Tco_1305291, partial [Tanacetum coccineum]